jgi:hypothetical protein
MLNAEQFWQYAEEAMRRADESKNDKEKRALLQLARTWTQAAVASIVAPSEPRERRRAPLSNLFHRPRGSHCRAGGRCRKRRRPRGDPKSSAAYERQLHRALGRPALHRPLAERRNELGRLERASRQGRK